MGATGKDIPPLPARKGHTGRGVSLTRVGLNPNNWHVGVNPNYWYGCHGQRNTLPCQGQRDAGRGVSLNQAGFMVIVPPFVPAYHVAEERSEDWVAYRCGEDSNFEPTNKNRS